MIDDVSPEVMEKLAKVYERNARIVKRRREDREITLPEGENARYIRNSLHIATLPPIDRKNPAEVQDRVIKYFEICEQDDMKPSVVGLAVAMDVDRRTLYKMVHGTDGYDTYPSECRVVLKRAFNLLNLQLEDSMQNGRINPIPALFLAKNHFGYADKSEVVITPTQSAEDYNADDIRDRYLAEQNPVTGQIVDDDPTT